MLNFDESRDVNPARAFLLDNYAVCSYGGLPAQEVYACYVRYCQSNGYRPLNSNNFGKGVKRTMPSVIKERKRISGRIVSMYSGLAVKEESEVVYKYGNIQNEYEHNLF